MKKYLLLFSMLCAMAFAVEGFADDDSIFHIGGSYTRVRMKPNGYQSFDGNLGGAQAIYEYKPRNFLYEALSLAWRQGSTDHASQTRFMVDIDGQERIGYTFASHKREQMLTLFSGLGFRYIRHNLKQPGLSTIRFDYKEFYIPVGLLASGNLTSYCNLGFNLIWKPQVDSAVKIVPLSGANWIINHTWKNVVAELPLVFSFCKKKTLSLEFKPFFEYWQDGKTKAKTETGFALGVPGNTYYFYGAQLNLGWAF